MAGQVHHLRQVSEKHSGMANRGDFSIGGSGNRFFDEALFDAGAHVAGHQLDEIFCFQRRERSQQGDQLRRLCGLSSRGGQCIETRGDGCQAEVLRHDVGRLQQFFRGCAQIPILAIDGVEPIAVDAGHSFKGAHKHLSAHLQFARIRFWKNCARKKLNGEPCGGGIEGTQILRHGGALGEFAARGGQHFAQLRKLQPCSFRYSHGAGSLSSRPGLPGNALP